MKYIYDDLSEKVILITGGAGFIGSNIAKYLNRYHPQAKVVIFDRFCDGSHFANGHPTSLGHFKNLLNFKGDIIVGNLTNSADLARLDAYKFDYIFHQAAISDTTCQNQELVLKTNYESFEYFINKARADSATLIYASSAAVYGNLPAPNTISEDCAPENIYGYSKWLMDKRVGEILRAESSDDFNIIGLRYFNVYGNGEYFKGTTASMILQLIEQIKAYKKVRLFEFGEQMRDFVYVKDVIQANIKAIEAQKSGIYNVGSGKARSFNDIIAALKTHFGEFEVEYIKNPYTFYQNHTEADIELTQKDLFYEPRYSLEDGISDYIECSKGL